MSNLKRVTISDQCMQCGLCEQGEYSEVFESAADGSIQVRSSGLVDVKEHPEVLEAEKLCPIGAIQIQDEDVAIGDKKEALQKLNDLIYQNLRDYYFNPPTYRDCEYEIGVYKASKIKAEFRSECKYRSYEGAENAGLQAFKSEVWSQAKGIARQYIISYRVKQLEKYYIYEETESNYYYQKNQEIQKLLAEAYRLAKFVTDNQISLPSDFCNFDVQPDLRYSEDQLAKIENINWDFERTSSYQPLDEYRTYIDVDDYGDDQYYYDFQKAEQEFRDDMDRIVRDLMDTEVPSRLTSITSPYLKTAQKSLLEKTNTLQEELRKYVLVGGQDQFRKEIETVCMAILKTECFVVSLPKQNFDYDYNSEWRFYSRRDCEKAGENRRERAYDEGRAYIRNLPNAINEICMNKAGEILTQWKRLVIRAYDNCGKKCPQSIVANVGAAKIHIDLGSFDDVDVPTDSSIRDYISKNILSWCGSVGDVSYMSQYSCKIDISYDCDIVETIFGNIKETNKRYGYMFPIYEFADSSLAVGQACVDALNKSCFVNQLFRQMQESFVRSLQKQSSIESTVSSLGQGNTDQEEDQWGDEFNEWD